MLSVLATKNITEKEANKVIEEVYTKCAADFSPFHRKTVMKDFNLKYEEF